MVKNEDKLSELGFTITLHNKMPDVVLYSEEKNRLYFIESVTSVGPMEPKRTKRLKKYHLCNSRKNLCYRFSGFQDI